MIKPVQGPLIEGGHIVYDEFVNVDLVKAPYYNRKGTSRFFAQRRKGYRLSNLSLASGTKPLSGGTITDKIEIDGVVYYMWISNDEKTIRVYKRVGCELQYFYEDCFCGQHKQFILTTFPKGKAKQILQTGETKVGCARQYNSYFSSTSTNTLTRDSNTNTFVSNQTNSNQFIPQSGYLGNFSNFSFDAGVDTIRPGDYIVTYKQSSPNCGGDYINTGVCGQVKQAISLEGNAIKLDSPWSFNPGTLGPNNEYIVEPQTEGKRVEFQVFSDIGETFGIPTCRGIRIFHDLEKDNIVGQTEGSLLDCAFGSCYQNIGVYDSGYGNILYSYNAATGAFVYSMPGLGQNNTESFTNLGSGIIGMTTFQNYVAYFGSNFVGAIGITKDTASNAFYTQSNKTRNNLGIWKNSNGLGEAYTQYSLDAKGQSNDSPDSLYFVGSNKHIYTLSIVPDGAGRFIFRTNDLTDEEFCKTIYGDLENIRKGDDVYLDAYDDFFRVIINSNNGGPRTTILQYNKRYKIRTKHYICCAKITTQKLGEWFGKDGLYTYCSDRDCNGVPIEGRITRHIGDDVSGIPGSTVLDSFSQKELKRMQLQIGNMSDFDGKTYLEVESDRGLYRPTLTLSLEKSGYLKSLQSIKEGENIYVPLCNLKDKSNCETFEDKCENSKPPYVPKLDCECEEEYTYERCVCIEDKKHFLSNYANHHVKFPQTKGRHFRFDLVFTNNIHFGGFLGAIDVEQFSDNIEYEECVKIECDKCGADYDCHKKDGRIKTCV